MNPKQKIMAAHDDMMKSLVELVQVLEQIEVGESTAENEWTIDDNNGGRITLNYDPAGQNVTLTRGRLKLLLDVKDLRP